jgi:hypothetical protein
MSRFEIGICAGIVLAAGAAAAQPSETSPMETLRGQAHDAALHGKCTDVAAIAAHVNAKDPTYYANVFLRDAVITSCNEGVGSAKLPATTVEPTPLEPATADAPQVPTAAKGFHLTDTGRGAYGMLAGMGAGAVLGTAGAFLGFSAGDSQDNELPTVIFAEVGLNAGLALGITLVGNHKGGRGSYWASLGCGLAGGAASWLFAMGPPSDTLQLVFAFTAVSFPIAGAMTGYWTTHRHTENDIKIVPTTNGISVMGRF